MLFSTSTLHRIFENMCFYGRYSKYLYNTDLEWTFLTKYKFCPYKMP